MALPIPGYMSDPSRTEGELKTAFEDVRDAVEANAGGIIARETLTDLRALPTPGAYTVTLTAGYAAKNDGGDGVYWWNASDARADNGGHIIQP